MHMASGSRLVETLKRSGVKVYAAQVVHADELYTYWRDLAELVGRGPEAETMIADFDRRVSAYHKAASERPATEKPGVFLEAIHNSVKTFTPDSLPAWVVEMGGGRNVAADAKPGAAGLIITGYGPERLLSKAKEIDVYISQEGPMNQSSLKKVKERPLYRRLKAFKEGRVYKMREDILARPTPSLLKGLEEMAALTGLKPGGVSPAKAPEK
jgi:iron complex transport system substrate-binding protein